MGRHEKEGILNRQRINPYNFLIVCCLGLGSVGFGYGTSIIGTTLGQPSFIQYFGLATRSNGTDLLSATNGIYYTGGYLGTLGLPWVLDRYGRKKALFFASTAAVISGALMAGSVNIGMFLAFRFTAGVSHYMICVSIPMYMGEIVPVRQRGALIQVHAISFVIGYVIQGWCGFGFYFLDAGLNTWRPPMAIQCAFFLALMATLPWVPESPRWLCMQGRDNEAQQIIERLHATKNDPGNDAAKAEFYQIQKQLAIDRTLGGSWGQLFKKKSYRKRTLIGMGTMALGQSTGVLVINNYGPSLYASLGYGPTQQLLYPAAWLTLALGLTTIAAFIVESFPRPKYLAFGAFGASTALIIECALVANIGPNTGPAYLKAAVAMLFIFLVPYCLCIDGPQYTYVAEIFPMHIRAKGVALSCSMTSLLNIVWLQSAPTAFKNIGWKFYLVFIIFGFSIGAVAWFFFPDTQGLPLEEVAAIFGDADEVAIYQQDLVIDPNTHTIIDHARMEEGLGHSPKDAEGHDKVESQEYHETVKAG